MAPHAPPASPDLALLRSKLVQECAHICPPAVFHEAKSARLMSTQELWSWDAEGEARGNTVLWGWEREMESAGLDRRQFFRAGLAPQ
jgi:hypothetical protein